MTNQLTCRMKCQAKDSATFKMALRFHRIPLYPIASLKVITYLFQWHECGHNGNMCKAFRARVCPHFSAAKLKVENLAWEDTRSARREILNFPFIIYVKEAFGAGNTHSLAFAKPRGSSLRLVSFTAIQKNNSVHSIYKQQNFMVYTLLTHNH